MYTEEKPYSEACAMLESAQEHLMSQLDPLLRSGDQLAIASNRMAYWTIADAQEAVQYEWQTVIDRETESPTAIDWFGDEFEMQSLRDNWMLD